MTTVTSQPEQLLQEHFGFATFRPGQRDVIEHLLEGHSAAAVFSTGGGKSLCYQLPAIALPGLTLVVSPLIALMKDQIDALQSRGISAARLDSSLSNTEYREVIESVRGGQLQLLYVAPERFNNERFRQLLSQFTVSLFAVDEAHCISEWGHNFRPDYLKLARFAEECGAERVLALTATAPPKVLDDICREFSISPEHATRTEFYRSNLKLLSTPAASESRDALLLSHIQQRPRGATIVYVTLQKTAETVAQQLARAGLPARAYHAGLKSEKRMDTQDWFLSQSDAIIVATIAFGMGIDKSDIRYVYHYNLAKSIENYAQEIGRAGRDGQPAVCETFVVLDDLRTLENFVYGDTPACAALHSLVADVFSHGQDFGISVYQLARRHDIRDLVVRTLLTYLELDGYLQGGTPYYAEYQFKPILSSAEILGRFAGGRRDFLAVIFRQARPGTTWFHLDIEQAAAATKSDRQRVVRALDYLAEQEMLELKVAGVHHRFRLLRSPNVTQLSESLYERSLEREQRELKRLERLLALMKHDGCQVSALGAYFGEPLPQPCGHCTWCEQGQKPIELCGSHDAKMDERVWNRLMALKSEHPDVFAEPRSLARFACGVTSPILSKAKLTRHELFGCLEAMSFPDVLERC